MDRALAQRVPLTCPQCGQSFETKVYLIVDAAARPDLLVCAQAGALHTVTSPHCGGEVDAPLLVCRAGSFPRPERPPWCTENACAPNVQEGLRLYAEKLLCTLHDLDTEGFTSFT